MLSPTYASPPIKRPHRLHLHRPLDLSSVSISDVQRPTRTTICHLTNRDDDLPPHRSATTISFTFIFSSLFFFEKCLYAFLVNSQLYPSFSVFIFINLLLFNGKMDRLLSPLQKKENINCEFLINSSTNSKKEKKKRNTIGCILGEANQHSNYNDVIKRGRAFARYILRTLTLLIKFYFVPSLTQMILYPLFTYIFLSNQSARNLSFY
jgi:hypothetical protein